MGWPGGTARPPGDLAGVGGNGCCGTLWPTPFPFLLAGGRVAKCSAADAGVGGRFSLELCASMRTVSDKGSSTGAADSISAGGRCSGEGAVRAGGGVSSRALSWDSLDSERAALPGTNDPLLVAVVGAPGNEY